ncbi:hypothetical protein LTR86_007339 [Recurvomyces mirabilis]|nr:hypothetical protein LTR86_007339 [Recurvomyces mirabilis]
MIDSSIVSDTPLPQHFERGETTMLSEGEAQEIARDDDEAVTLFLDVIATIQKRDSILALRTIDDVSGTPVRSLTDILLPRISLRGHNSSIRDCVHELVRLNSIIIISHMSDKLSPGTEAVDAAVETIQLIEAFKDERLITCLWMWLYYAFTAATYLFLHVVRRPLSSEATLHLALVSDVHEICTSFAPASPAARRIQLITESMDRVGFKLIKTASKKRALEHTDQQAQNEKRYRVDGDTRMGAGSSTVEPLQSSTEAEHLLDDFGGVDELPALPTDFTWEDWETWFRDSSTDFNF